MDEANLASGLLECARAALLRYCETHPEAASAELADATDLAATARDAAEAALGGPAMAAASGATYLPWSEGARLGFRLTRPGEPDQFIYFVPGLEGEDLGAAVLVFSGTHGDADRDGLVRHVRTGPQPLPARAHFGAPAGDGAEAVTVELPWDGRLRLAPLAAARLVVGAYGERAGQISISARQSAHEAYLAEVARLLDAREAEPSQRAGDPMVTEATFEVTVRHYASESDPSPGEADVAAAVEGDLRPAFDLESVRAVRV